MSNIQTALNSSIRSKQDSFESVSSVDADISVLENDIAVTEGRRDRLDEEIQNARYDEQIRERATLVNQKNANRDQLSADIAILNSHAEQRAKLDLKRSSLESKIAQMDAS
jgi:DNA repair protein RAD50